MTTTSAPARDAGGSAPARGGVSRLWDRKLSHYPETGPRSLYLGITVLATVVLYYELYVGGAVATQIISEFGFTFTQFVFCTRIEPTTTSNGSASGHQCQPRQACIASS